MALAGPARYAASAGIGLAAGATLGLVGWGGAQVIQPSLTHPALGLSQLAASGVSLASLSVAVCAGASRFAAADNADLLLAAAVGLPSIAGAALGSRVAARMSSAALALVFNGGSVLLLPTHFAVQRWRQQEQQQVEVKGEGMGEGMGEEEGAAAAGGGGGEQQQRTGAASEVGTAALARHALFGGAAGVLSALMGVGGLPVTMTYLTLATDLPHHLVQGTAMAAVAPSVLTSALARMRGGHTPLGVAAAVTCGSVAGSALGAGVALSLSEEHLRALYMLSLALLGGRSFFAAGKNITSLLRARARSNGKNARGAAAGGAKSANK